MRSIYILFRWKHPTWKSIEAVGDPMISNRDVGVKFSNIKNCTPYSMGSKATENFEESDAHLCSNFQTT